MRLLPLFLLSCLVILTTLPRSHSWCVFNLGPDDVMVSEVGRLICRISEPVSNLWGCFNTQDPLSSYATICCPFDIPGCVGGGYDEELYQNGEAVTLKISGPFKPAEGQESMSCEVTVEPRGFVRVWYNGLSIKCLTLPFQSNYTETSGYEEVAPPLPPPPPLGLPLGSGKVRKRRYPNQLLADALIGEMKAKKASKEEATDGFPKKDHEGDILESGKVIDEETASQIADLVEEMMEKMQRRRKEMDAGKEGHVVEGLVEDGDLVFSISSDSPPNPTQSQSTSKSKPSRSKGTPPPVKKRVTIVKTLQKSEDRKE
eukprot:TRINITY_DN11392_c0_g1_i1.p1 TRINITY_DN11392_c0_g1~~TRINITY_DN11392_c0_g1_i1.p1  ORF type:complete len:315 (-),score=47.12 TRINITY_DN11392_c0_g1_i1:97-1041(-)